MGFLDLFRSASKQIELENKLLAKPKHTVAEVVGRSEYDREERFENANGDMEWRTVREAIVTFRFLLDGQWCEQSLGPSEGYMGFYVGQQLIVKHDGRQIYGFRRTLRKDSPNRI